MTHSRGVKSNTHHKHYLRYKEYQLQYRRKHRIHKRKITREYYQKLRKQIFDILGEKCRLCGFTDYRALQIDHVNGGGHREIKRLKNARNYYLHVLSEVEVNNSKYQILCANCNWIKRYKRNETNLRSDFDK